MRSALLTILALFCLPPSGPAMAGALPDPSGAPLMMEGFPDPSAMELFLDIELPVSEIDIYNLSEQIVWEMACQPGSTQMETDPWASLFGDNVLEAGMGVRIGFPGAINDWRCQVILVNQEQTGLEPPYLVEGIDPVQFEIFAIAPDPEAGIVFSQFNYGDVGQTRPE